MSLYLDLSFSSDDDAPIEFNTSTLREKHLSKDREIRETDKKAQEKKKEKRRKRNEKFKHQKEQKLLDFGKRALPEDVLEAVSAKNTKLDEENNESIDVKDDPGNDATKADDRLSGNDSDDENVDESAMPINDEDFISLDSSVGNKSLNVVTVEAPRKNKSSLENALAFRNNQLYHTQGKAPPRETAKQRHNRMLKKKHLKMKRK